MYFVTPKSVGADAGPPYYGAAILRFSEAGGGQLGGNYWTSQQTTGHFQLSRAPRRGGAPRGLWLSLVRSKEEERQP